MGRDLFKEYGIKAKPINDEPVDIFEKEGIYMPKESKGFKGVASDALNKAIETAYEYSKCIDKPTR